VALRDGDMWRELRAKHIVCRSNVQAFHVQSHSNMTPLVCDTIPAPRLDQTIAFEPDAVFRDAAAFNNNPIPEQQPRLAATTQQPQPRKLCARHQRMADQGINVKLQQVCL
jgi:F-box/WD-40 domain protein MET30